MTTTKPGRHTAWENYLEFYKAHASTDHRQQLQLIIPTNTVIALVAFGLFLQLLAAIIVLV